MRSSILWAALAAPFLLGGSPPPEEAKEMAAREVSAKMALNNELKLARAEGLITSLEDMKAWVPAVPEEQNAAPFYRKLKQWSPKDEAGFFSQVYRGETEAVESAQQILAAQAASLKLIDQAVTCPKLWFDRDWSLGWGVLRPELAPMKSAVKLLLIRGSVARAEGRPEDALEDQRKALVVAGHLEQEKGLIELLVGNACRSLVRHQLLTWAVCYPEDQRWLKELKFMAEDWPVFSQRDVLKPSLYEVLVTADLCSVDDKRTTLGYKAEDIEGFDHLRQIMGLLQTPSESRLKVVKAYRGVWRRLAASKLLQPKDLEALDTQFWSGMIYEPLAANLYEGPDPEESFFFGQISAARASIASRTLLQGALRILERPDLEPGQAVAGIKSPADGLPIRVFQGKGGLELLLVDDPEDTDWPKLKLPNGLPIKVPEKKSDPR